MDYSKIKVGDKVYVSTEKTPYKVMARNERFIICNRPIYGKLDNDGKRSYWYFICDLERGVRGKDDLIFTIYVETVRTYNAAGELIKTEEVTFNGNGKIVDRKVL